MTAGREEIMRDALFVAFVLTLFAGATAAQVPNGNIYFGYTYYNTNLSLNRGDLNGFQATLEGKLLPVLGIVADFTGHYGAVNLPVVCSLCTGPTTASANAHQYQAMFGPRLSFPAGKFRPFAEFEVGVGHVTTSGSAVAANLIPASDTSYATALGGGLDYKVFSHVAWRLEGDYVRTHFFVAGQNNLRLSTGLAFRF
jgi:opacity protein-like surface antigen